MRGNSSFQQKSVAIFLSLSLVLFNSVSFAAPVVPHALNQATDSSSSISIPEAFGRIEESFTGNPNKTIIYIQDAHDSLEAQENIARTISHLVEHYGVNTVYEEGYEGSVPTDEYFGFIKDLAFRTF